MQRLKLVCVLFAILCTGAAYGATADAPDGEAIGQRAVTMPTLNTDGSTIQPGELASARLYWRTSEPDYDNSRSSNYDATVAGADVPMPFLIGLIAEVGEIVTILFTATATDVNGNESAFSHTVSPFVEVSDQYLVVDNKIPMPPGLAFDAPYTIDVHNAAGEQLGVVPWDPMASIN